MLPLGVAAPAQASPGCLQESGPSITSCDDTSPPVFTANDMSVTVTNGVATVAAHATYSDADSDPIGYQCALDAAARSRRAVRSPDSRQAPTP